MLFYTGLLNCCTAPRLTATTTPGENPQSITVSSVYFDLTPLSCVTAD
jgi:hypothetical protein